MKVIEAGKQRHPAPPKEMPVNTALVETIINARPEEPVLDPLGNRKLTYFQEDQALLRSIIDQGLVPKLVVKFSEKNISDLLDYFRTGRKTDEDKIESLLEKFYVEGVKLISKK